VDGARRSDACGGLRARSRVIAASVTAQPVAEL